MFNKKVFSDSYTEPMRLTKRARCNPSLEPIRSKHALLIIGHARSGKDTVAEILAKLGKLSFQPSSIAANEVLMYPKLKKKYGYSTPEECFEDRVNHRGEWYDTITEYNSTKKEDGTLDRTRLAREIMAANEIYVGMRNRDELVACQEENIFTHIAYVQADERGVPPESSASCTISDKDANYIINNNGDLEDLTSEVMKFMRFVGIPVVDLVV